MNVETFKLKSPDLVAEIYYLKESEGGRKTSVGNGYRGQFYYDGKDWDASQEFIDRTWCNLGETVKVKMQTASPEYHLGKIKLGMQFDIREGSKTVGIGRILEIFREDFNFWDQQSFIKNLDERIKPYEGDDLLGFRIDFDGWLTETEIIDDIQIEMTGNLECMILIKCTLSDRNLPGYLVGDKIIECWNNHLRLSNHLYKVNLETNFSDNTLENHLKEFTLTFATWSVIYLTGKIIVER